MIKRSMFAAVATASLLASSAIAQAQAPEQYDLLIDNGTIYDGMGGAPFTGDVAIRATASSMSARRRRAPRRRQSTQRAWPCLPASSTC
ncbi:hypothetical protein [Sphingomonas sediminicola]|uniref:hypothetical protein n=1 Tax=Sphingomonas sediminicola TaxID=386874 RepID=UPI001FE53516|nr:hypothetical protein [Sphingomonas sediminicola]